VKHFLLFIFILFGSPSFSQYCNSNSTLAAFCSTSDVSLNTISNTTSGCNTYSDFSFLNTELIINQNYQLTIELENCQGFTAPKTSKVYIDWNADKIFQDSETVLDINATLPPNVNLNSFSANITVPSFAVKDTVLMRVVTMWSVIYDQTNISCGVYGWGETEDYSIIIKGIIDSVTTTPLACYGDSSGSIIINSNNNNLRFSIDNGISWQSNPLFSNLTSGLYNIIVEDTINQQVESYDYNPVQITSPNPYSTSISTINPTCFNEGNGEIFTTVLGATPPYFFTYEDFNGGTYNTNPINNVYAGFYSLEIYDANNCFFSEDSIILNDPPELIFDSVNISQFSGYNISCNGASDGQISVFVNGGTSPYLYNWSNTSNSLPLNENLFASVYSLTVIDDNLCMRDTIIELVEPEPITVDQTITPLGCENINDGSVSLTINGGSQNYTCNLFHLDNDTLLNQNSASGFIQFLDLSVGNYELEIFDENQCEFLDSFNIENPLLELTGINLSCYESEDGEILFSVLNTNEIFSLNSPSTINNLSAGDYYFNIESASGCYFDSLITLTQPSILSVSQNVEIVCDDNELSTVKIEAGGGTPPYSIFWDNSDTTFTNELFPGSYQFTIRDSNNCEYIEDVIVKEPSYIFIDYDYVTPSCQYNWDGELTLITTGGYRPYRYRWQNIDSLETDSQLTGLNSRRYEVFVIDSADCKSNLYHIDLPHVYNDCFFIPNAFTPNGDGVNDIFIIDGIYSKTEVSLTIFNSLGAKIIDNSLTLKWDGKFKGKLVPTGLYSYLIRFDNQYLTGQVTLLN
tara:strand:- start:981 stop:3389 length:2409 start_codon:yes stop_codon:yes gene_type:complete